MFPAREWRGRHVPADMAANVRSYLAGRGIPDSVMTTEAFGESRPLVDTPDDVREPQNRRCDISTSPVRGATSN